MTLTSMKLAEFSDPNQEDLPLDNETAVIPTDNVPASAFDNEE